METVIPAIIVITLLLLATFVISEQSLTAQEAVSESWQEMQERVEERTRTALSPVEAETREAGAKVEITLQNDGDTKLADFDQWDVILQYNNGNVQWYPFSTQEASGKWTVVGIYLDASEVSGEVYDPGILNPGEEILLRVLVSPSVGSPTTNLATIATPNGITASTVFTR